MNASSATLPVALLTNADSERSSNLVLDLLDAGYRVVLTGRYATVLTHSLHGMDDRVYAIAADIADPTQFDLLRERVVAHFGRLDEIIAADTGNVVHVDRPAA